MKRVLSLLLAVSLCFSLAACENGKKAQIDSDDKVTAGLAVKTEQMVSVQEFYPFGEGCLVDGVTRLGNNLLIYGENESSKPILGLIGYTVDSDGNISFSETKMLALDEPDAVDESNVYGIFAGGDRFFYVLTGEQFKTYKNPNFEVDNGESLFSENPDYQGRYSVLQYSEDGEFLERIKIRDWPYSSIEGIAVGNEGEIVLYAAGRVSLVDRSGTELHTEAAGAGLYIQSVSNCDQGLIVSMHEVSKLQGSYYCLNSKTGFLTQLNRPGVDELYTLDTGSDAVTQGLSGEYVLYDSYGLNKPSSEYRYRGLYSVDFSGEISSELYRLGITEEPDSCAYISLVTEDAFVYTNTDRKALFLAERRAETEEIPEDRSVVNVAAYGNGEVVQAQLDALNAAGGKYYYKCTSYSASQYDLLMTEISTENTPDLVLFYSSEPMDTNSDYFEDLYSYLDADPELSRESFVPNLLDALSVDGRLTQLWQYVTIYTVSARTADVGDGKGLTPEDYIRILEGNENYKSVFLSGLSEKSNIIHWVTNLSIDAYTDKENAACSFDSESFAELLRWTNTAGSDTDEGGVREMSEIVAFYEQIRTPTRIHAIGENYGEPFTLAGFPIGEERGHYYSNTGGFRMAIPALGSNKEGAWEFIRNQLTFEAQYDPQIALEDKFPNIPANFEAMQRLSHDLLTEEEVQILIDLAYETTFVESTTDAPLREIIVSAGQSYFAGDKTLEETVEIIQNRASVYMAEKYG